MNWELQKKRSTGSNQVTLYNRASLTITHHHIAAEEKGNQEMGAMQTIEHAQSKTYKFSFPIPYKSQCNAHQGTDCPPPDMGDTGYTNGPKGDDNNEKQQVLHNTATAAA